MHTPLHPLLPQEMYGTILKLMPVLLVFGMTPKAAAMAFGLQMLCGITSMRTCMLGEHTLRHRRQCTGNQRLLIIRTLLPVGEDPGVTRLCLLHHHAVLEDTRESTKAHIAPELRTRETRLEQVQATALRQKC